MFNVCVNKNTQLPSARSDPYPHFVMEFDEEVFPLEAELSDVGPTESVDFSVPLENKGGQDHANCDTTFSFLSIYSKLNLWILSWF